MHGKNALILKVPKKTLYGKVNYEEEKYVPSAQENGRYLDKTGTIRKSRCNFTAD